jgi:hypothetical protein
MKRLKLFLFSAMAAGVMSAQAQQNRGCATMDVLNRQLQEDPQMQSRMDQIERDVQNWISANPQQSEAVITIPVVFHVVYNTTAQNISDARILAQLDVLNKDYARLNSDASNTPSVFSGVAANTQIQFCLAQRDPSGNATSGIVRKSTTVTSWSTNDNVKYSSSGGDNAWPAASYLNIWICNLGSGLLGYAQFPGGAAATDGVVVLYSSVGGPSSPGTATPYHLGRTATHEVGHWLNLRHIWGDANCGNDQVSDTPTQQTSNYGCPTFPKVTCSNGPNGDMFMNYMDYTDDGCMNMFTAGQASRMTASINASRSGLLTSLGCTPPSTSSCGTPSSLAASSITTTSATLSWAAVSGAVSYNLQYKLSSASSWTTVNTTSTSYALSGLTAATAYQFQVQAVCSSTSSSYSAATSFTTLSSAGCSDTYESNNTSSTASTIATNTDIYALISSSTDKDWFKFTTTAAAPKVNVLLQNLPADYDVRLYNASVSQLGISQNGSTTSESIKYNSSSAAATYYVQVYGYNSAYNTTSCYKLRINTSASNFRIDQNETLTVKDQSYNLSIYPNPSQGEFSIAFNAFSKQEAKILVYDISGKLVSHLNYTTNEGTNVVNMKQKLSTGMYFLNVITDTDQFKAKITIN